MRLAILGAAGALVLVSSGVALAESEVVTSSAPPHAFFATSVAQTMGRIVDGCREHEEPVRAEDSSTVVCEIPMGLPERIAARVVLREPFAHSPRAFVRFTVAPKGANITRVQVAGWVVDSRPLPNRRTMSLAGDRFNKRMDAFLSAIGGGARPV